MTITKSGVTYNLEGSPYWVERHGMRFMFSSNSHRMKFMQYVRMKEDWLCDSFQKRFHFAIDAELIACLQLYVKTETRGFRIEFEDGTVLRCLDEARLDGLQISRKGSRKQSGSTMLP